MSLFRLGSFLKQSLDKTIHICYYAVILKNILARLFCKHDIILSKITYMLYVMTSIILKACQDRLNEAYLIYKIRLF